MHDIPVPGRTKVIGNAMELSRQEEPPMTRRKAMDPKARLDRAWHVPTDESAVIGAAKELCEAAARVISRSGQLHIANATTCPNSYKPLMLIGSQTWTWTEHRTNT